MAKMAKDNICLLFTLPDELIYDICHLAALSEIKDTYKTRRSMVLVSKRMNWIATPILYRYLGVYWEKPAPWKSKPGLDILASKICLRCMHACLTPDTRYLLGRYCKSLQLYIHLPQFEYQQNDALPIGWEVLTWFSGVTSWTIGGQLNDTLLLKLFDVAIYHMPQLQKIMHIASPYNMKQPRMFLDHYRSRVSTLRLDVLDDSLLKPGGLGVGGELVSSLNIKVFFCV